MATLAGAPAKGSPNRRGTDTSVCRGDEENPYLATERLRPISRRLRRRRRWRRPARSAAAGRSKEATRERGRIAGLGSTDAATATKRGPWAWKGIWAGQKKEILLKGIWAGSVPMASFRVSFGPHRSSASWARGRRNLGAASGRRHSRRRWSHARRRGISLSLSPRGKVSSSYSFWPLLFYVLWGWGLVSHSPKKLKIPVEISGLGGTQIFGDADFPAFICTRSSLPVLGLWVLHLEGRPISCCVRLWKNHYQ